MKPMSQAMWRFLERTHCPSRHSSPKPSSMCLSRMPDSESQSCLKHSVVYLGQQNFAIDKQECTQLSILIVQLQIWVFISQETLCVNGRRSFSERPPKEISSWPTEHPRSMFPRNKQGFGGCQGLMSQTVPLSLSPHSFISPVM